MSDQNGNENQNQNKGNESRDGGRDNAGRENAGRENTRPNNSKTGPRHSSTTAFHSKHPGRPGVRSHRNNSNHYDNRESNNSGRNNNNQREERGTFKIDIDILEKIKREAKYKKEHPQYTLNRILRKALFASGTPSNSTAQTHQAQSSTSTSSSSKGHNLKGSSFLSFFKGKNKGSMKDSLPGESKKGLQERVWGRFRSLKKMFKRKGSR